MTGVTGFYATDSDFDLRGLNRFRSCIEPVNVQDVLVAEVRPGGYPTPTSLGPPP
tara:strand:+ start:347 stop:511 length:165 start_codon:yes stop_codon:yes gene_type:complete